MLESETEYKEIKQQFMRKPPPPTLITNSPAVNFWTGIRKNYGNQTLDFLNQTETYTQRYAYRCIAVSLKYDKLYHRNCEDAVEFICKRKVGKEREFLHNKNPAKNITQYKYHINSPSNHSFALKDCHSWNGDIVNYRNRQDYAKV